MAEGAKCMIRLELYKPRSHSGRALAKALGVLRTTPQQVRKYGDFPLLINWGSTERRFNGRYINRPEAVALAVDKLKSLEAFLQNGVPHPEFTTDYDCAAQWREDGLDVIARRLLRANSGRGIVLVRAEDGEARLPRAPLYTKYIKKADEYRVHIMDGQVLDISQKRKRRGVEDADYQIRNHHNGWVYCREDVDCPDCVVAASLAAVSSLGLEFGAVDCGYNRKNDVATVYEVNTAPGLEGTTLERYVEGICDLLPQLLRGRYVDRRRGQRV